MLNKFRTYAAANVANLFLVLAIVCLSVLGADMSNAAMLLAAFAGTLKVTRRMPSWEGVVAGQTATLRMPIGLTYHQLWNEFTGVTLAQMDEIRIVANGQTIQQWDSGTELDRINQYQGRSAAAGILAIDFDRFGLNELVEREFTALGTGHPADPTPVTTLQVEVDINAAAAASTMASRAVQSIPQPLGLIKKVRRFVYSPTGAIDFEISDLPKGDVINQLFFQFSANDLNRLRVERDTFIVFDREDQLNERIQADGVRVPQASQFVYDPTEDGVGTEGLITAGVNDLRFVATMTGAATLTLQCVYIGGIDA